MEDNHEQYRTLAEAKSRADNSDHSFISKEGERQVRFILWFFGGLAAIVIAVTGWVYGIQSSIATLDKRVTLNDVFRESTKAKIEADNLTHAQTQQQISAIQALLTGTDGNSPSRIKQLDDMWQMKIRGESNKEAFFREHGYAAPMGLGEYRPTPPPAIASSPTPTPR